MLNSRVLTPPSCHISKILHLFPKVKQVEKHNKKIQKKIDSKTINIRAKHVFSQNDIAKNNEVSDDLIPKDDRDAGGLPLLLTVSCGTRVMLIRNIYTNQGLVNGAMGYVELIEFNANTKEPKYIYVKFDDGNVGKILQNSSAHNAIPIEPIQQEFHYNGRCIVREQFPLIPSWACSIHKVQGASLDQAAISIGNEVFQNGMSYVALSRVRTLGGIYLIAFNPNKVKPCFKVVEEYERLRRLVNTSQT